MFTTSVLDMAAPRLVRVMRVVFALSLLFVVFLFSWLGGFLNRCRGGYANLQMSYWLTQDISREIFSLSSGLMILLFGFNIRGGFIVWLLTQWSLLVDWSPYMNIGTSPDNFESQTGIFDWLIGRQEEPWNYTRRFIRDFSGMSLRGLVWTLPQGYVLEQLDFGWQYSLSGSLMGVVYYIGSLVSVRLFSFFNSTIAYSEFIWGTWIWFVLVVCNATQLIHYARQWIHSRRVSNLVNPHAKYHQFLYKSLNHEAIAVLYQLLVMMLWAIFAASVVFYSLVIQPDIRNKGQTEFGLFISTICLTFFIGWKWSSVYTRWQLQKSQIPVRLIQRSNRTHSQINTIGNLQRVNQQLSSRETDPLLPWPYSHPDKARYSPVGLSNDVSRSSVSNYAHYKANDRLRGDHLSPLASCAVSCWGALEKWVWLDLFAWIRHMIGILSLIATLLTVAMALIAFALDLYSPRFDSKYVVCNATTI